ncbi:PREDICTED: serine/arginine repetitive matrix protein 2 [Dinoponera quadriceps]|uniref:Fibroblast growth factor n=1 Tax=Dinoponera quadriceps TaxID=609295 RepID=A0A6P3XEP7_DINQU|nr:PREDICTED: serine/arginine repetitive matrix protein 2 [Dinoponera quadriceps]
MPAEIDTGGPRVLHSRSCEDTSEPFASDDGCSSRDQRPEEEEVQAGEDPASRKRRGRVRSLLRLAFLLFLVAFGRSARKLSAGPSCVIGTVIGAVSAAPVDLVGDAGVRAERSANLSHITGASRKIQMYVKNRHLQILPDGTVNGSNDDTSDYTIFQRTSVSKGQLRIQGVATCLYLCMDVCGLLYGSREYTNECIFNENLEQHNYNTYSSVRWSTEKKTMYLGLNRSGQPRRVQTKGKGNLGKLSAYARVLTQVAPSDRVEALQRRMLGAEHNVRHRHHERAHHRGQHGDVAQQQPMCPTLPMQEKDGRDKFRCRKRKKRKKRKRRCRQGERPGPQCQLPEESVVAGATSEATEADASPETGSNVGCTTPESKRSCEGAASEEACRRQALSVPAKKRKSRIDCDPAAAVVVVGRNLTRNGKNKAPTSNAKKPNVGGDSQSKKPDLTDGKKKRRKRPATTQPRGSATSPTSSQKRYALGTTSSQASSSLTAPPGSEVVTASSSSSPSSPGASSAPSDIRVASPKSGRKKPSSSPPRSPRPVGSRRVGKSFGSAGRARSTPPATKGETAQRSPPTTTKVPETTTKPPLPPSPPAPASSSLVDEEPSEVATGKTESTASTASSEVVAELTTLRLLEEDGGSGTDDAILRATTRSPFDRLAM